MELLNRQVDDVAGSDGRMKRLMVWRHELGPADMFPHGNTECGPQPHDRETCPCHVPREMLWLDEARIES